MSKEMKYYKDLVEEIMDKPGTDARMTVYFLEAIRAAAKNDERVDVFDFSDLSTCILGQIDAMYDCNPGLHYIIHDDREVLA